MTTQSTNSLRILFIASEADPFVKVGGLGDVAGTLPRYIRKLALEQSEGGWDSVDIRLAIPLHGSVSQKAYGLRQIAVYDIQHQDGPMAVQAYDIDFDGLPVYFIGGSPIPTNQPVYTGDPLLDGRKYTFFSLASLELTRSLGWKPHLLHANDWHTAPAVYALSTLYAQDPFFCDVPTLLSLHNLPYLGVGAGPELAAFGLPPASQSGLPWWGQDLPLPLGLMAADHIVAVSPTYAKEILTPEFGSGLYEFLATRSESISGILNGIDTERWNPETDPDLALNYNLDNLPARKANKTALQLEAGLDPDPDVMLIAMINRMDNQKGVDLALDALQDLAQLNAQKKVKTPWQAIILGTGAHELEEEALKIEAKYPDRIKAILRFDQSLSRRIYGGADALLIPSRYEPCGLAQMIAMHYGCVPVARATGGLRDTIIESDHLEKSTGFLFEEPTSEALLDAMRRALQAYAKPSLWVEIQKNGMREDFSWERSARQYVSLYQKLTSNLQNKPSE
jgi:starch synthase